MSDADDPRQAILKLESRLLRLKTDAAVAVAEQHQLEKKLAELRLHVQEHVGGGDGEEDVRAPGGEHGG